MKKINFVYGAIITLLFVGCNQKQSAVAELQETQISAEVETNESELDQTDLVQEQEEPVVEIQEEIPETVGFDFSDKDKFVAYDFNYVLDFEYSGLDTKIFTDPSLNELLYTVQTGDKIEVSKIVDVTETGKTVLYVKTPSNENGFINLGGKNPFADGNFSYAETLEVDGNKIDVLTMHDSFAFGRGITLTALPSGNSEIVYEFPDEQYEYFCESVQITKDYEWVKIDAGDVQGWIPAKNLSKNRGGPTLETPENTVAWSIIDSNFI